MHSHASLHVHIDTGAGSLIPVHNVKGGILSMVVEYTQYHVKAATAKDGKPLSEEEVKTWDSNFVNVEQVTLFELILAANYLNIKSLLDLTCMTVAEMIKGKTPEEIRTTFNIKVRIHKTIYEQCEAAASCHVAHATLPSSSSACECMCACGVVITNVH